MVLPQQEVTLASLEDFRVPLFVTVERTEKLPFTSRIQVTDQGSGKVKELEARLLGPPSPGR